MRRRLFLALIVFAVLLLALGGRSSDSQGANAVTAIQQSIRRRSIR